MILNDLEIQRRCKLDKMVVPYMEDNIQPHSLDLTLGYDLLAPMPHPEINGGNTHWGEKDNVWNNHNLPRDGDEIAIPPYFFMLATTNEYLNLPLDIVGFVNGKSTIGRRGLQIECAGLVDAGFSGNITLELFNMAPYVVTIRRGMPICQMTFHETKPPKLVDYRDKGHYNGQRGATPPHTSE